MLGREKEKEYFIGSKRTEKMKRRIVKIDKKLINEIEKKQQNTPLYASDLFNYQKLLPFVISFTKAEELQEQTN